MLLVEVHASCLDMGGLMHIAWTQDVSQVIQLFCVTVDVLPSHYGASAGPRPSEKGTDQKPPPLSLYRPQEFPTGRIPAPYKAEQWPSAM